VRAFVNAGGGTFTGGPHHYLGWRTGVVAVGDFDADGIADLAAPNSASFALSVLRGLGGGAFLDAPTYATGRSPNAVVTGDFNEDGRPDLITATYSGSNDNVVNLFPALYSNSAGAWSLVWLSN